MVSSTHRPQFTPAKELVSILEEAGWAPGPVWTGGKSRPHPDFFFIHPNLLPYYCYITVHILFDLPRNRQTEPRFLYCLLLSHSFVLPITISQFCTAYYYLTVFVLSVTISQFCHLPPLPTLRLLNLFVSLSLYAPAVATCCSLSLMLRGHHTLLRRS